MVQKETYRLVDLSRARRMVIIKDQEKWSRNSRKFMEKSRQDRLGWCRLRGMEDGKHARAYILLYSPKRGNQIRQESRELGIALFKRKPRSRALATG
ncbi:hypothetical protein J53TS2_14710 [Paenibacillus sp. J53TS2]|nr:hypothetical protein J53TS2_14710 [Paenibacillus sp. J53TS2]